MSAKVATRMLNSLTSSPQNYGWMVVLRQDTATTTKSECPIWTHPSARITKSDSHHQHFESEIRAGMVCCLHVGYRHEANYDHVDDHPDHVDYHDYEVH